MKRLFTFLAGLALAVGLGSSHAVSPIPHFVGGASASATAGASAAVLIWKLDSASNDDIASAVSVGSGAVTVTRAGANIKTRIDASGLIDELAANTLLRNFRWDGTSSFVQDGWEIEEASTNLVLRSEDFSAAWAAVGLPTRTAGLVASGDLALDNLSDDSAVVLEGYSQTVTFTGNAVKAVSLFAAQGGSTSSVIRVRDVTGLADRLLARVTWSGGAPVVAMTTGTHIGSVRVAATGSATVAYRLLFATTSVTAASTNSLQIYPATDAALAIGNTGDAYFGGVQAENRTRPSSYIPTAAATVTRPDDVVTRTTAGIPGFLASAGMLYVKARSQRGTVPAGVYPIAAGISGGSNEQTSILYSGDDGKLYTQIVDGGVNQMFNDHAALASDTSYKAALPWALNNSGSCRDGGAVTNDASTTLPTPTTLTVGGLEGIAGVFWGGTVQEVEVYAGRPTDGYCSTRTGAFALGSRTFTVGSEEVIVSKATRDAAGLTAWPDGTFGITKSGADYTFYASNSLKKVAKTVGTLANPLATSTSAAINIGSLKDTLDFASGGPVYEADGGLLLMFYHGERWPGGDSTKFYATIRMAKSTDGGASWTDLGEIIRPNTAYPQTYAIEVGSAGFITKDGYFYVYFNDHNGTNPVLFSAARALISDVVTAANSTDVTPFSKWTAPGVWSADGLTGLGASMVSGLPVSWTSHIDAAYNTYAGKYVAVFVGLTDGVSLGMLESADGEYWSNPQQVIASGGTEEFYPSLIGTGSDPQELGQTFWTYYTKSTAGGFNRWNDAVLARRLFTLAN